ncbi:MAG: DUF86 domain-containing protein [Candidatus Sungbacteria bacterium]|nr:DUF86 domain-containing protein [Candidatus Sungbacteria bacterium]
MSTLEVIENKISYIKKHLAAVREYRVGAADDLKKNPMLEGAVERELYVLAQAAIDLAEAVVAFKNLRKPTTMREAFDILAEANLLPKEFVERFVGIVGFRNALAHDYEELRLEVIYDVLQHKLPQIEEFLSHIRAAAGIA